MSPDPGTPVGQTNGGTLIEYFEAYLTRPDVVEQLKPLAILFTKISKVWEGMFQMAAMIGQRAIDSFPSRAYAPLLIDKGVNPSCAHALASLAISRGSRIEKETKRLPAVVGAIRFLAKPGRRRRAILCKAEVLLAAWEETSIIETIFDDANLLEFEFIGLLKSVVDGREVAWQRITEIAATIAPLLSIPRGPKITAASAAHEVLLEELGSLKGFQGYSWNPYEEDFTDFLTLATRREFTQTYFDPRPACRRLKNRRKLETNRLAQSAIEPAHRNSRNKRN
jgi:hypothetical protein